MGLGCCIEIGSDCNRVPPAFLVHAAAPRDFGGGLVFPAPVVCVLACFEGISVAHWCGRTARAPRARPAVRRDAAGHARASMVSQMIYAQ